MSANSCAICDSKNLKLIVNLTWPLFKCQNCGLIQVHPLPSRSEVNKLYQGDYWKNYGPYGSQEPAHRRYFEKKIAEIKQYRRKGRMLDIGCALGTFMIEAKKQGFAVEGIDISDYAVSQCRRRGLKANQAVATDLKKTNYYDIITAFETVEHEYDAVKTVKTIYSLLRPGGLFVATVPNTDTFTNKIMGRFWFGYRNQEHLYHFNKKSLYLLLKQAGFQRIEVRKDSPRPYLATYYLERINYYLFRCRFFAKIISKLKKIPLVANFEINWNPWGNLIAFGEK